jgi:hypothetical protein
VLIGIHLAVQESFEVANESMDITVTLLDRFGGVITAKGLQAKLQPALLPLLDDPRTALRKRTITCLCAALLFMQRACCWALPHCCLLCSLHACRCNHEHVDGAQRRWLST